MSFNKASSGLRNLLYHIAGPKYKLFITITLAWKKIVGSLLAERAFVYKVHNNVLYIGVSNHVWMQELVLQKQIILEKLNKIESVNLRDIIFNIREEPYGKNSSITSGSRFSKLK